VTATPPAAADRTAPTSHVASGPTFWVGLVLGWSLILFGFHNAFRHVPGLRNVADLGRWLVGGLVVHDGFWVPVAIGAGWLTSRLVPATVRAPVRVGLALSAMLAVATLPVTRRYGATADNPSIDPNDATAGLLIFLALIWLAMVAWVVVRHRRSTVDA